MEKCPSCHQNYQNELAVELANEFVSFVEETYPDDQGRQVMALDRKLDALRPKQNEEKIQIANKMLSIVGEMKRHLFP